MVIVFLLAIFQFPPAVDKPDSTLVMDFCDLAYGFILQNADSAVYYGERAIDLAEKINYRKGLAQAYNDLGLVYYYQSDYSKSKELWNASLEIRKQMNDSLGIAALYVKLGALTYQTGSFSDALTNHLNALTLYEGLHHDEGMAKCFNNIALVHESQNQLDMALEYYQKALQLKYKLQDYYEIGGTQANIGRIYYVQDNLEGSNQILNEAISTLESNGFENTVYLAAAYNSIGKIFMDLKKLDEAAGVIAKGIAIRQKLGDQQGIIASLNQLGLIESERGNSQKAIEHLTQAIDLAREKQLAGEERTGYQNLSVIYRKLGNYQKALESNDRYHAISDSLLNEYSTKTIAELQTKYETEKKEQQIALQVAEIAEQQAENQRKLTIIIGLVCIVLLLAIIILLVRSRERKKQILIRQEAEINRRETQIEAALSSQEKERSRFAKDLHDGFGQMISLLNLNLKPLEKGDTDKQLVFEKSTEILNEMYQELKGICFNLMPQTLIQHGIGLALREFADRINSADQFQVTVDIFGLHERLSEVQEISLYRITQEWVNNIMKYSDADKVIIQLTKDEEEITLLIEDNGRGFEPEQLKSGQGNGWKNINSRSNLIKGELQLDTTPGLKGTTLIINAPAHSIRKTENTLLRV